MQTTLAITGMIDAARIKLAATIERERDDDRKAQLLALLTMVTAAADAAEDAGI